MEEASIRGNTRTVFQGTRRDAEFLGYLDSEVAANQADDGVVVNRVAYAISKLAADIAFDYRRLS